MKKYVYDPKSEFEITRIAEREKNTRKQRALALEDRHFENVNRILDVGCGTGVFGFDLLNRIPTIRLLVGLDIEPSILGVAKHNHPLLKQVDFITGDAFQLPLKTGELTWSPVNMFCNTFPTQKAFWLKYGESLALEVM